MSAAEPLVPVLRDAIAPPEYRGLARDEVRLLVTDRTAHTHRHARFGDLPDFVRAGDLFVVNDSATVPAALRAVRRDGGELMLHLATHLLERLWLVEPRAAVVRGEALSLPGGLHAVLLAPLDEQRPRLWCAELSPAPVIEEYLAAFGEPIRYGYVRERFPLNAYQTIFARVPGSAEMPSAARPFSPRVVHALRERGATFAHVTLHCGVSSYEQPERPASEPFEVPFETADAVRHARDEGRRVIAVGSTVVRALESSVRNGLPIASAGRTDLVLDERYVPHVVDALLTGFHHASATHQWMLRAFAASADLREAYRQAAEHGYRQHEFGDSHLIIS